MWVSYSQCIYGWLQTTLYKKVLVIDKIGETVRSRGMMYKSVTQLVILYGSDIWVVTGGMLKVLEGFHHRAARQIKGMMAIRGASGEREYPPGGGGNGIRGTSYHQRVHQETAGNHIVKVGLTPHLWTLRQGRAYYGDKLDGEMVGPGHVKWIWVVDEDYV